MVPLLDEPLDVALPADHILVGKAVLRAEDVIGFTWVGVPEGFPFDTVLRQIEVQADSRAVRAQLYPDLRVLEALVSSGHGLSLLPRYTALRNQGSGFVLRPLEGVKASRSIVALARPDVAARTTIQQVLAMLKTEARAVAEAPGLREPAH